MDHDRLVLMALGDGTADQADTDHLDLCPACRAELDTLREVAELAAETQEVRDLPDPPERVWQRITAEVATARAFDGTAATAGTAPVAGPGVVPVTRLDGADVSRHRRRLPSWARLAVTGVAAAVVAVAGTLVATRALDPGGGRQVTASANLAALAEAPPGAHGDARVLGRDDRRELLLHVQGLPLQPGYYEVWLLDPDNPTDMVAVGQLGTGADAQIGLPPTMDLNRYRLVDISMEPYDGNAAHSGRSMLRGELTR